MTQARDPRPEGGSLHRRIIADIEARILSGEWPPGWRIPFEHELTAQYGCARMTVSKALTQLAGAGLIERRRKAGTFVTQPHSQSAVLEIPDVKAEVAALGLPYRFAIVARSKRRATRADRVRFAVAADAWIFAIGNPLVDGVWSGGRKLVAAGRHAAREPIAARYAATMRRFAQ